MATPTIVVIHAAAQPPPLYQPLADALQKAGFPVEIVDYPSAGYNVPKMQNNNADLAATRNVVSTLIESGEDVIVFMHSYGGIVGTGALQHLGEAQREKEGKKGVIRLVYAAAFALREGETVPNAGKIDEIKWYGQYFEDIKPAMYAVFHDLEPTKAEHWYSLSGQQSVSAMWSKQKYEAWRDIPSTYVHCLNDRVIPPDFQAQMVRNAKDIQPNAFDVEERLRCGHNPVLSNVGDLVAILKKAAGQ